MNNNNQRTRYRRSRYRRRRTRAIAFISIACVVLLFILFVIVGNILNNKTKPPSYSDDWYEETESHRDGKPLPAKAIGAYALPLLKDGSTFSQRLAAINQEANAVCINLNQPDGTLLFRSGMLGALPGVGAASDASPISNATSSIEGNGLYSSGILYVTAFNASSDLMTDVELSVSGALACEAIRDGVGDVLLIAPSLEVENVDVLCSLADRIHLSEAEAIIGILLSEEILDSEDKATIMSKLSKHFNYMCLDATQYGSEDPLEHIERKISEMQLDIMYYKMRVLLPYSEDTALQSKYIETVKKYNISSWQVQP